MFKKLGLLFIILALSINLYAINSYAQNNISTTDNNTSNTEINLPSEEHSDSIQPSPITTDDNINNRINSKITNRTNNINSSNLQDDANLVYLLDQFYNNAWNKLLIVITTLISIVGIGFPVFFEYIRNKKSKLDLEKINDAIKRTDAIEENNNVILEENEELRSNIKKLTDTIKELKEQNSKIYDELSNKNYKILKNILESIYDTADDVNREYIQDKIIEMEKQYEKTSTQQTSTDYDLKLKINNQLIGGNTVKEFYRNIIDYLIRKGVNIDSHIPHATGKVRNLINYKNEHVNGSKFTSPIRVQKYYIETHKSKTGAYNDMLKFLNNFSNLKIEAV